MSISVLRPGDRVMLKWNGYPGVPKDLADSKATVVRVLRSRVEVQPDLRTQGYTITVRQDQLRLIHKGIK